MNQAVTIKQLRSWLTWNASYWPRNNKNSSKQHKLTMNKWLVSIRLISWENKGEEWLSSFSTNRIRLGHRSMHFGNLSHAHILLVNVRSVISQSLNFVGETIHEIFSKCEVWKVKLKKFIFPKMIDQLLYGSCASQVYFYSGL